MSRIRSYEFVWMGAAFERLFDVTTPIGEGLAGAVTTLFSGYEERIVTWNNVTAKGNLVPDTGPWRKRWIRTFYARRSSIHAGSGGTPGWSDLYHGLIAAEVFSLSVKKLLADNGLRSLTSGDEAAMDALDERIESLFSPTTRPDTLWEDALDHARSRAMTTGIAAALGPPTPSPTPDTPAS